MATKSIPIKLDKMRRLCFDFNAFAELQGKYGIDFQNLQKFVDIAEMKSEEAAALRFPLYELRGFMWAGLLDETPDITLKEVGKILDNCLKERPAEILEKLLTAMMECPFLKEPKKKAAAVKLKIPKTGAKAEK